MTENLKDESQAAKDWIARTECTGKPLIVEMVFVETDVGPEIQPFLAKHSATPAQGGEVQIAVSADDLRILLDWPWTRSVKVPLPAAEGRPNSVAGAGIHEEAAGGGTVPVIVSLVAGRAQPALPDAERARVIDSLLERLAPFERVDVTRFDATGQIALKIRSKGLISLDSSPLVCAIYRDEMLKPMGNGDKPTERMKP